MNISRTRAKELIAEKNIASINTKEASSILSEYWQYEDELDIREDIRSGELPELDEKLISLMVNEEEPNLTDLTIYSPLFLDWKVFELKYTTNEYLEKRLQRFGLEYEVEGKVEEAGMCPCCKYYSIDPGEDGLWEICTVCFWENGGDGPNHMTLKEAQENFERIGVMSEKYLSSIDLEGPIKYARNV